MNKPKVLVIVGDATETVDTLYPFYRLIEAGFQPVVAAPEKRKYQMVLHEVKPGWTITKAGLLKILRGLVVCSRLSCSS